MTRMLRQIKCYNPTMSKKQTNQIINQTLNLLNGSFLGSFDKVNFIVLDNVTIKKKLNLVNFAFQSYLFLQPNAQLMNRTTMTLIITQLKFRDWRFKRSNSLTNSNLIYEKKLHSSHCFQPCSTCASKTFLI